MSFPRRSSSETSLSKLPRETSIAKTIIDTTVVIKIVIRMFNMDSFVTYIYMCVYFYNYRETPFVDNREFAGQAK